MSDSPALDFAALANDLLLSQSTGADAAEAAEEEAAALEDSTLDFDQEDNHDHDHVSSSSSQSPPSQHRRTD